jgi:hypothetical protein
VVKNAAGQKMITSGQFGFVQSANAPQVIARRPHGVRSRSKPIEYPVFATI